MLMTLGFKTSHDPDDCTEILDRYGEGGEGGVRRQTLRKVCNFDASKTPATDLQRGPEPETTGVHVPQTHSRPPRTSATDSLTPRQLRRRGIGGRSSGASQSTTIKNVMAMVCLRYNELKATSHLLGVALAKWSELMLF